MKLNVLLATVGLIAVVTAAWFVPAVGLGALGVGCVAVGLLRDDGAKT